MKKTVTLLMCTIILLNIMIFQGIKFGTSVKNLTSRANQKHINLVFTPPEAVKVGNFDWLRISDCSYFSMPGDPMLPIKSVVVTLPLNSSITEIAARVENVSLKEKYFVMPALTPVQAGSAESPSVAEPDPAIYGKDELYPNEWFVYRVDSGLDPETNTRVEYVDLYFYPLRYLPTQKTILFAQNVTFTISYTEPIEREASPIILKNLIITSDALEQYADQLATYKNATGTSSLVLNTTWVYNHYGGIDHPEQIRNCIRDFVAKYGIIYVTIFGDADQVPVRYVYVTDGQDTYTPTDLYYADLKGTWDDNNDGLYGDQRYDNVSGIPDVYVGRIPPSLASSAETAVNKIIGYQAQFNASESWTNRVVLAAGTGSGDGVSNPFGIAFPFLKNYTADININKNIVRLYEAYGNLSTDSMTSELNKGALFVNFAGHGNPTLWLFFWIVWWLDWYNGYGTNTVQGLTNGYKLPVITTMACSTAEFDDTDCIGEYFVLQPDGGSIAYFGPTRIAWGYPDQGITTGLMGEMDWRIYQNYYEGWTRLGQMWGETVKEYVQNHIWNYEYASVYDIKTFMEFELLGDPTLRICNPNSPETLNVPKDYPTIQSAINAAYDGDTVNVSAGTYYENVVVNKSISLIGQEKGSTIIDGSFTGNVLNITAFKVNVNGFTIRGSGTYNKGIYVNTTSYGNNVSGNIITGNYYGIYLDASPNNTVNSNNVTNNAYGIYIFGSSNNSIVANNATSNSLGILLNSLYSSANNNILRANRMALNYYDFAIWNGQTISSYVNDVDSSNTVDGKPIYYWVNRSDETIPLDAGYVALINCTRIVAHNLNLTRNGEGMVLSYTKDSAITKNNITINDVGVDIRYSSNNTLSENLIYSNDWGIMQQFSSNNSIIENSLTTNTFGIDLFASSDNHIYRNNMNNTKQVLTSSSQNVWDNGYPSGGNYWSDYAGKDEKSGPSQDQPGSDGIGDTAYVADVDSIDHYPLMNPWVPKEVPAKVHLLLTLEPYQATYVRSQSLTLGMSVLNQLNPSLNSTLTLTVTGPDGYYYFDFQTVNVKADAVGEYSFAWDIPNVAGTYVVEVSFIPPQLTAYDAVWLKVV